ncbi:polynucleotide adenylyltransferase PcnB [Ectothiorhodospiraceae bacterium WFHF3C12]|nr:polynucleotide adenylyltransferase PcnB [Ectothiorhodospiraceae bacterium WFHF3C12]
MSGTEANSIDSIIIPRSDHRISRADISENALKVLYRLKNAGFEAYLVGGGVRDLSLGREPKDFDIATDARPEEVKDLFRNCRLIGRRFRLAHVHFGREIIEVATFRALHDPGADDDEAVEGEVAFEDGRIVRDNVYGTLEEDALRRDFSVNALYYNIADFSVVDHVGGMSDLDQGLIRLIGDPEVRYREDPVRMLRAIRFAVKLGFKLEGRTAELLPEMAPLLEHVPAARLFDEVLKLLLSGMGLETFEMLRQHGLFGPMFPETDAALEQDTHGIALQFISRALDNTDRRIAEDKPVTPAFLFGALMWPAVQLRMRELMSDEGHNANSAVQEAGAAVHQSQVQKVMLPKRFGIPMREIWSLQPRLERRNKRALRLLGHPRFRAAYDFLLLRAEVGEVDEAVAQWWTDLQEANGEDRQAMAGKGSKAPAKRRRRGRRKPQGDSQAQ